jgi:DNA mismatch endonuclease (patch repair protein)
MADVHSKALRSYNMSQIKSKDTKPELLVRKYLFANGLRFKIHVNKLPGKPDIVLPKYKTVIFVNGCFWHGHKGCKYFILPKTRQEWWRNKIQNTVQRDRKNIKFLKKYDWNVILLYECEIRFGWADKYLLKNISK